MTDNLTNRQIVQKLSTEYNTSERLHYVTFDDLRNFRIIVTPQQLEFLAKYSHRGVTLDDTHHCTKYNLKLSTMLVCDGYDRGVPVAFLLSYSTTSSDIEEMFKCVKEIYPAFNPAFVMTDEANVFWAGFRKVFPATPAKKVLCRWHICRTWKKQAKTMLKIARKLAKGIPRLAKNHKNCRVAASSRKDYVVLPEPAEYDGEREFLVGRVGGEVENMYRVVEKSTCLCLKNENCHCNCGACGYRHSCTCLVQEAGVCCKHVHMVLLSNGRLQPDPYPSCHSPIFDTPSSPFPSSSSLSIHPAAPVSLDDVDQTEKDKALKNFDKLVNAHSALEEHLRQLMKKNSRSAADEIQKALDSVMALLPNSQPSLPPRRASATNCSARDVMNKHIRLEPRRYSRPCPPSTSSAPLVPIAELSICAICLQVDAPLPDDADPMEDSSQWNYWKKCPECELPAHWECALGQRSCAHCNVEFVDYE
ncbi:hypothetical protein B9Z55_012787 [Caenorhabditis nigoni]|uniref:MULE transposase domain-containing protein n=1 Tax=Caenorhabditis nigoni TaxID=1611254 RepID=A0A2G5TZE4_9PELO|nr:hypothetical protein B9Z55_012787 [Caenorhabditis nigoni]